MVKFISKPSNGTVGIEVIVRYNRREAEIHLRGVGGEVFIGWFASDGDFWRTNLTGADVRRLQGWGFRLNPDKDKIALGNPD